MNPVTLGCKGRSLKHSLNGSVVICMGWGGVGGVGDGVGDEAGSVVGQ